MPRTIFFGGGTPTAFDRVLATRLGLAAVDAVHDRQWGTLVALRSNELIGILIDQNTLDYCYSETGRSPRSVCARLTRQP